MDERVRVTHLQLNAIEPAEYEFTFLLAPNTTLSGRIKLALSLLLTPLTILLVGKSITVTLPVGRRT